MCVCGKGGGEIGFVDKRNRFITDMCCIDNEFLLLSIVGFYRSVVDSDGKNYDFLKVEKQRQRRDELCPGNFSPSVRIYRLFIENTFS